jgi:archaellin
MPSRQFVDRRSVLKATALLGLGATGTLAGCSGGPSGSSAGGDGRVDSVPGGVAGVGYANVEAILGDSALRSGINDQLQSLGVVAAPPEGSTVEDTLDRIERATGLDLRQLQEVVGFYRSDVEAGAAVVWSEWSESTITDQLSDYTETTYGGRTLYEPEYGGPVAVLSEGEYAVGSSEMVRAAVDAREGEDVLSGGLREAYAATRGMGRFAGEFPPDAAESAGLGTGEIDAASLGDVEYATGSLYADGSSRGLRLSLLASSGEAAEEVRTTLQAARELLQNRFEEVDPAEIPGGTEMAIFDRIRTFVEDASISTDGDAATVSYVAPAEEFARNSPAVFTLSGLLINAGGFLQASAESSSSGSSEDVASGLLAVSAVGGSIADGSVGVVRITVKPARGAPEVDLRRVTARVATPDGTVTLDAAENPGRNFGIESVRDDDGSIDGAGLLNDAGDRAQLVFDLRGDAVDGVDASAIGPLPAGTSATVQLVAASGAGTALELTVPESLAGEDAVPL